MSAQQIFANRYHVHTRIGSGAMGDVFQGMDTQTNTPIAVKILKADLVQQNADMLERFIREGEALRALNHPNIVRMIDAVEENGQQALVMEYVTGGNLAGLLSDAPNGLPLNHALSIALDLADALTRAHRLGIIHRDIKPANVLIAEDGTPRLTDFGIAHFTENTSFTETGAIIGTYSYLSPEACMGQVADEKGDIWAFGVLVYEMLTGSRPFEGNSPGAIITAILNTPLPDVQATNASISDEAVDLLYRMLDKNVDSRIPSVRLIGAEIEGMLKDLDLTPTRPNLNITKRHEQGEESIFATPEPATEEKRHNLPVMSTPFIGRAGDLRDISTQLHESGCRVITLLGPGGMGKTRLGIETASQNIHDFQHGATFVPLAPLTSADNIVPAIADAAGFQFSGGTDPKEQLLDYFREKQMLLVMDNYEHVIEGARIVGEIVDRAPGVKVIATSRARLKLSSECVYDVGGMHAPTSQDDTIFEEFDAVEMFITYARRVLPDYELIESHKIPVVRICQLVGGMPLGIELAAGWSRSLPPDEIAEELEADLDFLETEMADVPERHRSMRAAFDYSWKLLDDDERSALMKFSVFRGGATRTAARTLTGASLRTLMNMVDKSLLSRDPVSGRFHIHEMLRQFAYDALETSGELEQVRDAHCTYYASALADRRPMLESWRQKEAMLDIDVDKENARFAWEWATTQGRIEDLERMILPLYTYLIYRNVYVEGEALFGNAIDSIQHGSQRVPRNLLALMYTAKLDCVKWQYDFDRAEAVGLKAVEVARESGDRFALGLATGTLSHLYWWMNQLEEAEMYNDEALEHLDQETELFWYAQAYHTAGNNKWWKGDIDGAEEIYKKELAMHRKQGNKYGEGHVLNNLALISMSNRGMFEEAERYFEESYEAYNAMDLRQGVAWNLMNRSELMLSMGKVDEAIAVALQSMALVDDMGNFKDQLNVRATLSEVYRSAGDLDQARYYAEQGVAMMESGPGEVDHKGVLESMAMICRDEGKLEEAKDLIQNVLDIAKEEEPEFARWSWVMASVLIRTGEFDSSRPHIEKCMQGSLEQNSSIGVFYALVVASELLLAEGKAGRAVEIISALEGKPGSLRSDVQYIWEEVRPQARGMLSEADYQSAVERGKGWDDLSALCQEVLEKDLGG